MTNQSIINKLKERYDWRGYLISSVIACIGAFFLHLKDNPQIEVEALLISFLLVGVLMFIFMVSISEFLNYKRKK